MVSTGTREHRERNHGIKITKFETHDGALTDDNGC